MFIPMRINYRNNEQSNLKITQRSNWKRCDKELYQEAIRKSVAEKDTENLKNAAHEIEH